MGFIVPNEGHNDHEEPEQQILFLGFRFLCPLSPLPTNLHFMQVVLGAFVDVFVLL